MRIRSPKRPGHLAWIVTLLAPLALGAQEIPQRDPRQGAVVAGTVVDQSTGQPLPMVRFRIFRPDASERPVWEDLSDAGGRFITDPLPLGDYEVEAEAFGFSTVFHDLELAEGGVTDLRLEMVPVALALDPVVVTARRETRLERGGFWERRRVGLGHTFTREEIEERNPGSVSDLFYRVPGSRVVRTGLGAPQILLRRGCVPQLVVDGTPVARPYRLDEMISVGALEALEVYHGATSPARFSASSCGTIMAWTREGTRSGQRFSWRRMFAAAGFALLAVVATR
jgi:hypothetical protein